MLTLKWTAFLNRLQWRNLCRAKVLQSYQFVIDFIHRTSSLRLCCRSPENSGKDTLLFKAFLATGIFLLVTFGSRAQTLKADKVVELKAVSGLQYDKVQLSAKPGSVIKIRLSNTDEMLHNLLVTKPGQRERIVAEAGKMGNGGMEQNFIPSSSDVLASIPLLSPGESGSVSFKVPAKEGAYPYVCTYPGHGTVMYGVLYVTDNPEILPPLEEDVHVPEVRRNRRWMPVGSLHPYPPEMPQITRLFMPDASPAAIAVGMENNHSYCWDASVCHLRYVWKGGYIDPSEQWDAKAHEFARIVGTIYYKNRTGFPFRFGSKDSIPRPEFRGFEMVDGYPRFVYSINNITVKQLILPAEKGDGIQITFNLDNVNKPVWYVADRSEGVSVQASTGVWENQFLKLTPGQAGAFKISIIPNQPYD